MEASAREKIHETFVARMAPTGRPDVLARLVDRAVQKRKARVIYPRVYTLARYSRVFAQWITDRAAPPLLLDE